MTAEIAMTRKNVAYVEYLEWLNFSMDGSHLQEVLCRVLLARIGRHMWECVWTVRLAHGLTKKHS